MTIHNAVIKFLALLGLACAIGTAWAGVPRQSLRAIAAQAARLVRAQTANLPGKVRFHIGQVDPRLNLPACSVPLRAFVPTGARLWGNSTVGVRCADTRPWQIYVPVTIRVLDNVVIASQPLSAGERVTRADLAVQQADLTHLPSSVVRRPSQAVGSILTMGISAGQPLRLDVLRAPAVIHRGQTVLLRSRGPGFSVSSEGRAVTDAAVGALAQVRVASGRVITGIAQAGGSVEVRY